MSVNGQIVVRTCQSGSLKYHKYQDLESEVEEKMEKWLAKKLVAATVSSREVGQRRTEERETTSSRVYTETPKDWEDKRKSESGGRLKLKHADGDVPYYMKQESEDTETKMRENVDF